MWPRVKSTARPPLSDCGSCSSARENIDFLGTP
jgi:hypothetical protein